MSRIAAVATALPSHVYDQATITRAFGDVVLSDRSRQGVLERLHQATGVRTRHLAMPIEDYPALAGFGAANDVFIAVGTDLGERAVADALAAAGLTPQDLDMIMVTSVTGVAAPSLDARLVPRLGLRTDVKRVPIFGLGCVAGAAGIARVADYLTGHPDDVAVLLSVELCSLTLQRADDSMPNLVASGLFGDGAAAVVMVGERRAAAMGLMDSPAVVSTRSRFYPDTERVMGWDVGGSGFRIVLAASVADVVEENLGDDVRGFLEQHDLKMADVVRWVAHPGGPKVLHAMQRALDVPDGSFDLTWQSLAAVGNLSSASVLHVLAATLAKPPPAPGEHGMLLAMGPGFCAELVLLRW
ncbi:MAG: alkylresorcinol/alkylpyrone synthase [Actinomycetota bacterium]|nr:alkylresorcinol/alkylpyrone synthase [Actinomycetota bacterium]